MTEFRCPGDAERAIRAQWPHVEGQPETGLSQHDIRQFVAQVTGLACELGDCTYAEVGDMCGTTVCMRDSGLPLPGSAAICRFAGTCDSVADTSVIGKQSSVGGCDFAVL